MAQPGAHLPAVPANPTPQQIRDTWGLLGELVRNQFPAQAPAGLQQALAPALAPLLAPILQRLGGIEQRLGGIEEQLQVLTNRTSSAVRLALQHNAHSPLPEHALAPVPHPDTGDVPPNFPATNAALDDMSYAQLGALLDFYDQPVAGNRQARMRRLKTFIGKPS